VYVTDEHSKQRELKIREVGSSDTLLKGGHIFVVEKPCKKGLSLFAEILCGE
jgi:hypothetical protein